MKIDEVIKRLQELKKEYGNVEVIGADNYDSEFIEPQKFVLMTNPYNDIINRHTEDLDEDYLERSYANDKGYNKRIVSKGICVKIY